MQRVLGPLPSGQWTKTMSRLNESSLVAQFLMQTCPALKGELLKTSKQLKPAHTDIWMDFAVTDRFPMSIITLLIDIDDCNNFLTFLIQSQCIKNKRIKLVNFLC